MFQITYIVVYVLWLFWLRLSMAQCACV